MRIRTVKPEFWSHPVLSGQPDDVRLAALGILNMADDEGYFLAKPAFVRSTLWPFDDDSTKARRVLATLTAVGYIDLREHPSHGEIGLVINFTKHQRIDRPSPSKIRAYYDSTNPRRTLGERSLLEQGTGNREQGTRETHPTDASESGELFAQFWEAYGKKAGKKETRAKWATMTASARRAALDGVAAYVANTPDPQYRKDPVRYLKGERWEDDLPAPTTNPHEPGSSAWWNAEADRLQRTGREAKL